MAELKIGQLRTGIDRTRRFAVDAPDRFYDLVNCYVNEAGRVIKRNGFTTWLTLPANAHGLFGWRGKLQTFVAAPVANPAPTKLVVNVLRHPTGGGATIKKIHGVQLILGGLYVSAEFTDGVKQHYWLQPTLPWSANQVKSLGDYVVPTTQNGFYYEVLSNTAINAWQGNKATAVNATVQPTVANDFYYKATATTGTNVQTGNLEPSWPEVTSQTVIEVRLIAGSSPSTPTTTPPPTPVPPPDPAPRPGRDVDDIYDVRYGSK